MKIYCPNCYDGICRSNDVVDKFLTCDCGCEIDVGEATDKQQHELMAKAIMLWQNAANPTENLHQFLNAAATSLDNEMRDKAIANLSSVAESYHQSVMQVLADIQAKNVTTKTDRNFAKVMQQISAFNNRIEYLVNEAMPIQKYSKQRCPKWLQDQDKEMNAPMLWSVGAEEEGGYVSKPWPTGEEDEL